MAPSLQRSWSARCPQIRLIALLTLIPLLVACASAGRAPTSTQPPRSTQIAPEATADPASLWYRLRGTKGNDQGWGVDVDSAGNVYFASHQGTPSDWHIYKFAPDGKELWHRTWGRAVADQAFLVVVAEPFVYIGGNSESAANTLNPYRPATDMAIIALRADTGALVWERIHDFAGGYDEVDGIVVEEDAVYVSGWASGKTSSVDVGLLKLNKSTGQVIWATAWGTNNWDEGDGQMVILGDKIYVGGRYNAPTNILQTFLARLCTILLSSKPHEPTERGRNEVIKPHPGPREMWEK